MGSRIRIDTIEAAQLLDVSDDIKEVYLAAFAIPPYAETAKSADRFAQSLLDHSRRAGFRCCVALGGADQVAGFAYGYTSSPGQWWHETVKRSMDDDTAEHWLADAFELVDLAVRPEDQGRGIGGRLHDAVLAGLTHRTAVLSTRQADTSALHLYRRRGWVAILRDFHFSMGTEPWLIMGLELRGHVEDAAPR